jgi:hypothetical protein
MTGDRFNFVAATAVMVVVVPMFLFCAYSFCRCPCAYDALGVGAHVYAFLSFADIRARIGRRAGDGREEHRGP